MTTQHFPKIKPVTKLLFVFVFILISISINAQDKNFTIVLDAGHGGKDPGKVSLKKYKEKDVALSIVLEVGKILENKKDINVIYTRKKDVFVDLWERGRIANKANANLFVSVHCNAHNSQAYGAETWVLGLHANKQNFEVAKAENSVILLEDVYKKNYKGFDPNSPESVIGLTLMQEEYLDQSIQLASLIQKDFVNVLKRKDRGVKQAGFIVLHQTYMPSVLIETGFLTNKYEGAYLYSKNGQQKMAASIANAIIKYKGQLLINTVVEKEPIKVDPVKVETTITESKKKIDGVIFKAQIAAGGNKLETKSYNFKGLKGVERIKVGNLYKYYFGSSSDYDTAKKYLQEAKAKGYKTAFIVAFKDGVKVSLVSVLKTTP